MKRVSSTKKFVIFAIVAILGFSLLWVGFMFAVLYTGRPTVHYTVKQVNCSPDAIKNRSQATGNEEDACIINFSIHNYGSERVLLDLANISGPGFADWGGEYSVRIYDASGNFCYASVGYVGLDPNETKDTTIVCTSDSRHPNKSTDLSIDASPAYIEVNYSFSKTRINLIKSPMTNN